MYIFGVTITGAHESLASHRFYGTATDAESAILLATRRARKEGFASTRVDDVSLLGDLEFAQSIDINAEDQS